jgi:hypothetical protein
MNNSKTCVMCQKSFEIINEEATGEDEICPPEIRCLNCQVQYRLKTPKDKHRSTSWITYIYAARAEINQALRRERVPDYEVMRAKLSQKLHDLYTR